MGYVFKDEHGNVTVHPPPATARVLTKSGWAPFGPARGKLYCFDFPTSASMSGTYTFCVQSRDPNRNVSKPSCAQLVLS
jgi:hypothetical protein